MLLRRIISSKLTNRLKAKQFVNLRRSMSSKIVEKEEDDVRLPHIDWEDWMKQYPSFALDKAKNYMQKCKEIESQCLIDKNTIPVIDWEKWSKEIKTPKAVEILKAEFESKDFSVYSPFYYDDLTEEARGEVLRAGSEFEEETKIVGRDYITNGVRKMLGKENSERIASSKELVNISALMLEELQKDKEQVEMNIKRFHERSNKEDLAEYPNVARELEENLVGNGFANGMSTFPNDSNREADILMEKEDRYDKNMAEYSLRFANDQIDEYLEILKKIGVEVDKKTYIENVYQHRQKYINELRQYCRDTRSINSYDPQTGELLTKDADDQMTEIPGGG